MSAAASAAVKWGASAGASPLVTGYTELHAELEHALATWHGYQHGLVWNSGYAANSAVLSLLPRRGDVVLADRLIHASMVAGILRSGARLRRFPHNDLHALNAMLAEESERRSPTRPVPGGKPRDRAGAKSGDASDSSAAIFVVTESIFSMDGDGPDLAALAQLRDEFEFFWVLDEAHATGWFGETGAGALEANDLAGEPDLLVGTLGKAFGSQGAYTLFRDGALREWLLNEAGDFVYSTYLAPPAAGAALAALKRIRKLAPERLGLRALSVDWRTAMRNAGANVPHGESPIVPVLLGAAKRAVAVQRELLKRGFRVSCIRPPTVPDGSARLRVSLRRGLTEAQRDAFAAALKEALACA